MPSVLVLEERSVLELLVVESGNVINVAPAGAASQP